MTDIRISIPELRGPWAKPAALVTERELNALLEAVEAAKDLLDAGDRVAGWSPMWHEANDLGVALARFDFGGDKR